MEDAKLQRLKDLFPEWYDEGLDLAKKKGMNRKSIGAGWFAQGYVMGRLEAYYEQRLDIPKILH